MTFGICITAVRAHIGDRTVGEAGTGDGLRLVDGVVVTGRLGGVHLLLRVANGAGLQGVTAGRASSSDDLTRVPGVAGRLGGVHLLLRTANGAGLQGVAARRTSSGDDRTFIPFVAFCFVFRRFDRSAAVIADGLIDAILRASSSGFNMSICMLTLAAAADEDEHNGSNNSQSQNY